MKKTPLYEKHVAAGGEIIDFGGWALPVKYTSIIEEHQTVRTGAGLFDVSHMGEVMVTGKDACAFINSMVTNDITKTAIGRITYSPMCYRDGGVVDDLLVYCIGPETYLLVVNASNTDKDYQWLVDNVTGDVKLENISDQVAQVALQGPKSKAILSKLVDVAILDEMKYYGFTHDVKINGMPVLVSRTGYTGESGYEIYTGAADGPALWDIIMAAGQEEGLVPVGLGARDTLRFEAALPLYGQEISADITPLEAGLGRFVKFDAGEFIGKEPLEKQAAEGVKRTLVGFEMVGRGIARSHYPVWKDGKEIGFVTTGSYSPSLKKNIGMALIAVENAEENGTFDVMIREKPVAAKIIPLPFYKKSK